MYSILLFAVKVILCGIITFGVFQPNKIVFVSLGIEVTSSTFDWWEWGHTLSVDIAAFVCELVLLLLNRRMVKFALA